METARMRLLGVFFTCFALTGSINLSASANNFILTVSPPNNVQNGEVVHISWSGVKNPTKDDFIGLYCPNNDSAEHFVYRKTKEYGRVSFLSPASWINGTGTHDVHVYNLRTEFCEFRYYKINGSLTELLGKSKTFFFRNVADAPLHGHLALTGSPTEMRVMWTSAKVLHPIVEYGTSKDFLDHTVNATSKTFKASDMCGPPANTIGYFDPGYIHDALLTNLKPNSVYYYKFGTAKLKSEMYNFTTPIPAGDTTPFEFIAYGDYGISPLPFQATTTSKLVPREVVQRRSKFVLHLGDLAYSNGWISAWDVWMSLIEASATLAPYMIAVGNHEQNYVTGGAKDPSGPPFVPFRPPWGNYGDSSGGECGVTTYYNFHMPDNGHGIWWYSFDYGLAHFTVMSTEHDYSPGSRQYNWLKKDLEDVDRRKTPWVIFAGHRPMYHSLKCSGDYIVSVNMKRLFEELLYGNKVDLALWAHNHNYERSCKVYKTNCVSDGIVHLVIGTAGANLDDDVWYPVTYSAYREINYGFGRIAIVNRTALHIQFIRNKNLTVGDDFWILKPDLSELSRGRKNTFSSMTATWLLYISVMWLIHIHNTN